MERAGNIPGTIGHGAAASGATPSPLSTRLAALVVLPPVTPEIWTLITVARTPPNPRRLNKHQRTALAELSARYRVPVARVLAALGVPAQDIPDLVNEFLGLILPARVLPVANRDRGSFNGLLMRSLRNYLTDKRRDRRRRAELNARYTDQVRATLITRVHRVTPRTEDPAAIARVTNSGWRVLGPDATRAAIALALRRTERYCAANNMIDHWRAFSISLLIPAGHGASRPSLQEVAAALSSPPAVVVTPQRAAVMIRTVRRRLREELRRIARQTQDASPESKARSA